jgi:hypothetical protein
MLEAPPCHQLDGAGHEVVGGPEIEMTVVLGPLINIERKKLLMGHCCKPWLARPFVPLAERSKWYMRRDEVTTKVCVQVADLTCRCNNRLRVLDHLAGYGFETNIRRIGHWLPIV